MLIIGLTGSIGMGKSTAAQRIASHGIAVFDADAEVHRLYKAEAAPLIEEAFPGTVVNGVIDRARLAAALLETEGGIARLEGIVHPLVRQSEREFLLGQAASGAEMAVVEVPLLFETGSDQWVDVTIVVTAPPDVQRDRVLGRPGMTSEKLEHLLANQMADAQKRERADYVVDTSGPVEQTGAHIDKLIESLRGRKGEKLARWTDDGPPR